MKKFKYKIDQCVQYSRNNGDFVYGKIVARLLHPKSGLPCYTIYFDDEFESELLGETTNFCVIWEGASGLGLD